MTLEKMLLHKAAGKGHLDTLRNSWSDAEQNGHLAVVRWFVAFACGVQRKLSTLLLLVVAWKVLGTFTKWAYWYSNVGVYN